MRYIIFLISISVCCVGFAADQEKVGLLLNSDTPITDKEIEFLKKADFNPNATKTLLMSSPMLTFILDRDRAVEIIDIFKNKGANFTIRFNHGFSTNATLFHAMRLDKPAVAQRLLELGVNPLDTDSYGINALHHFAQGGLYNTLKFMLEYFKKRETLDEVIDLKDKKGQTLLSIAVERTSPWDRPSSKRIVDLLIDYGANPLIDYPQNASSNIPSDLIQMMERHFIAHPSSAEDREHNQELQRIIKKFKDYKKEYVKQMRQKLKIIKQTTPLPSGVQNVISGYALEELTQEDTKAVEQELAQEMAQTILSSQCK